MIQILRMYNFFGECGPPETKPDRYIELQFDEMHEMSLM